MSTKSDLAVVGVAFAIGMISSLGTAWAHEHAHQLGLAPGEKRLIETAPGNAAWMTEEEIGVLSNKSHEAGKCAGFMDITDFPDKIVAEPFSSFTDLAGFPTPSEGETIRPLLTELDATKLMAVVEKLVSYHNRYYRQPSGTEAAKWIRDEFTRRAGGRSDITVELFTHRNFTQPSVIARIAGNGPLAAEKVIIGGHLDSIKASFIGGDPTGRAPGADDNASGIATLLESFRVLAQSGYRPARTIEFIGYAGEEMGLLGSQDIAQSYKRAGTQVAGVIQFDMTMFPGPDRMMVLMTDYVHPELTRYVATLIDTYVGSPWKESRCGYGCSDHASWTQAGYASAFPFEASFRDSNPKIHTANDTIQNGLDGAFGLNYAKLALSYAVELSAAR